MPDVPAVLERKERSRKFLSFQTANPQDLARKTTYTLRSTSGYRCRQLGTYWLCLPVNMQDTGAGEVLDTEYIGPPVNLAGAASMTIWFGECCM